VNFASVAKVWPIAAPIVCAAPLLGGPQDRTIGQLEVNANPGEPTFSRSFGVRDLNSPNVTQDSSSIPSKLRDARVSANQHLLRLAARMSSQWRQNLAWQLGALLDPEEWDGDAVLDIESWKSFLRGLFVLRPHELPGIGLSASGNLVASWSNGEEHVDIEFRPGDEARWILAAQVAGEIERASGRGPVTRLADVIAPYSPRTWFAA
jgi:hypothetical protein